MSTSLPKFHEKRRHRRADLSVPLKISGDHGDILTETKNLSSSGAYCRTTQWLEPMTKLRVYLLLPSVRANRAATKKITCQGIVVRTQAAAGQDYYNTAIFFSDIAPKDSRTIHDYIESVTPLDEHQGSPKP